MQMCRLYVENHMWLPAMFKLKLVHRPTDDTNKFCCKWCGHIVVKANLEFKFMDKRGLFYMVDLIRKYVIILTSEQECLKTSPVNDQLLFGIEWLKKISVPNNPHNKILCNWIFLA